MDPITIKNAGDRQLRLADHAVIIATLDDDGNPAPLRLGPDGGLLLSGTIGEITLGDVTIDPSNLATSAKQDVAAGKLDSLIAKLPAQVNSRVPVDGSGVTQPVSATALPLPTGASTATNQAAGNASLASVDGKLPALVSNRVPVDGSGVTQPVSATALPLPTGAATASGQTTANASLSSIDGKLPALVGGKVPVTANPTTGTRVNSTAYESSHVLKNSAGTLLSLTGYNAGPSQFLQIFDSATVPGEGTAPAKLMWVEAQSEFSAAGLGLAGVPFSSGIAVCNSSTGPTKTIGTANLYITAVVQ